MAWAWFLRKWIMLKIYYMSQSWEEENLDSAFSHFWSGQWLQFMRKEGLSWASPTGWFTEGSCLQEICNLIFQTIRPTSTFPSRLPDVCLVLDLAGWPWVFISFLTTTALFGHLSFYTSLKWEPQLNKRDPNHTESWTMDNFCCPEMESTVCRSLLGELQSSIWYCPHADKQT